MRFSFFVIAILVALKLTACCCPWDPRCKLDIHFDDNKYGNNPWDPRPDPKKEETEKKK